MKDIFLSYIVPCYNLEHYLLKCINSLSQQVVNEKYNIEFIFVNDGSTDNTLSLLKEFENKDHRAIIIDQKNQGVSVARNNGLKAAHGKYVFFLDGDDWLTEEASQIIFEETEKNDSDIIISNAYIVNEKNLEEKYNWDVCIGNVSGVYNVEKFVNSVDALPISFKTYKRDFLATNKILYDEDLKVGEVYTFFLHALACANKVLLTKKRMMNYLIRGGSVMREYSIDRDRLILETITKIDTYASFFDFNVREKLSYNASLYNIVNLFGIEKYLIMDVFDMEVEHFLHDINTNCHYRGALSFFIFKYFKFDFRFINCVLLYFFPIKYSYKILKYKRLLFLRIKNIIN